MSTTADVPTYVELQVVPGPRPGEVQIFVSPQLSVGLAELLKASGLRPAPAAFAGPDSYLAGIVAVLGTSGMAALAPALVAFIERHRQNTIKFKVGDWETTITGYSGRDSERLLTKLAELELPTKELSHPRNENEVTQLDPDQGYPC